MISVGTNLIVADNSSAKIVKCLKVLGRGSSPKQTASIGDTIVVSIKQMKAKRQLSKLSSGEIYKAIVIETKKAWKRSDGSILKGTRNAAVLINSQFLPIGTRVLSWVTYELRSKKNMKILSLSPSVF